MTSLDLWVTAMMFLALSVVGALFVFRPGKVETYLQQRNSLYLAQDPNFFSVFLNSLDRTYLIRCIGFGMWAIALPGLAGVLMLAR